MRLTVATPSYERTFALSDFDPFHQSGLPTTLIIEESRPTASDDHNSLTLTRNGPDSLRAQILDAGYARLATLEDNDEDRALEAARHARRDRIIARREL